MPVRYLLICFLSTCLAQSYNQPKLCPSANWNPHATTFADQSFVGWDPHGIFIDNIDTIYIPSRATGLIHVWPQGTTTAPISITTNTSTNQHTLFVSNTRDIYINSASVLTKVDVWTYQPIQKTGSIDVQGTCTGLFIDRYNTLYCSKEYVHQVVTKSLNTSTSAINLIAGSPNMAFGSTADMLNSPRGIVVDEELHLYVADTSNNRIQRFVPGTSSGTTVVHGSSLNGPSGVALDGYGNLFIVDTGNHRILGWGPSGFRCIVGCSMQPGSGTDQLSSPRAFSFDSTGNIYVVDSSNNRIQRFQLNSVPCSTPLVTSTASHGSTGSSHSTSVLRHSNLFVPSACANPMSIGTHCNVSSNACEILQPCRNKGSCLNSALVSLGYVCSCPFGSYGPCQMNTCWNGGNLLHSLIVHCFGCL